MSLGDKDGILLSSGVYLASADLVKIAEWIAARNPVQSKLDKNTLACMEEFPNYPTNGEMDAGAPRSSRRIAFYKDQGFSARAANIVRDIYPTELKTISREELRSRTKNLGPQAWDEVVDWRERGHSALTDSLDVGA